MPWPHEVAAITGASSGIGRAIAREIARRGTKVVLLARRLDALREVASEIEHAGGAALAAACDVRSRDEVASAIALGKERFGPIDLLVASAGVGQPVSARRFDGEAAEEIYRVNVFGVLHSIEAVLPDMLSRRRGRIVGVSSLASHRGMGDASVYCSSKAALNVQLEGMRVELAPLGVHVTTVLPGFVRTPMTAKNSFRMPFLLEPEDAARRIVGAIERERRVFAFPWPAAAFVWAFRRTPNAIFDRIVSR